MAYGKQQLVEWWTYRMHWITYKRMVATA